MSFYVDWNVEMWVKMHVYAETIKKEYLEMKIFNHVGLTDKTTHCFDVV